MRKLVVLVLVMSCVGVFDAAALQKHPVNPVGAANAAFRKRLDDYLKMRKELTKKIPEVSETGNPQKITARERALGEAIAAARKDAKPGDLFGQDMTPTFAKILTADLKSRSATDRKALYSELPKGLAIAINKPYPTTLPLLTVPANLLANLPMLPEELEYRLIDHHLLMRDRDANLVLDALFNVVPRMEK